MDFDGLMLNMMAICKSNWFECFERGRERKGNQLNEFDEFYGRKLSNNSSGCFLIRW
jgi:hypothetical protein